MSRRYYSTINPIYEEFMGNECRYNVLWGGAGSSKSFTAAQKVVRRCLTEVGTDAEPFAHNFAVFRKFGTTVFGSVFKQLKEEVLRLGLGDVVRINESYRNFKFPNGAEIRCLGMDDVKIKSIVSTAAWIEEATELEEIDFSQLDLRYRGISRYYYQIILTFNPIDETHWLKRHFFDTPQGDLTYILHTTFEDNMFIDAQYKQVLRDRFSYDPNLYRIYVKGEWGRIKTGSEYFFNFRHDRHVRSCGYKVGLPLHISFDFNVTPYISAVVAQIDRREIDSGDGVKRAYYFVNVIDEFALPNPYNETEKLCQEIISKYEYEMKHGVYIYGDASGITRDTRGNGSDYDIIQTEFYKYLNNYSMRVPKANPLVRRRRWFINKILYGGFNIELSIDGRCSKLIGDFENSIESDDGGIHKQTARDKVSGVVYEKFGHHTDCFCYLLCEAFAGHYETMAG